MFHPLLQSAQHRHSCQETHVFRSARVSSQTSRLTYHQHWSHIDSITSTLNRCLPNIWLQIHLLMFLHFIVAGATRLNDEVNRQQKIHQLNVHGWALTTPEWYVSALTQHPMLVTGILRCCNFLIKRNYRCTRYSHQSIQSNQCLPNIGLHILIFFSAFYSCKS